MPIKNPDFEEFLQSIEDFIFVNPQELDEQKEFDYILDEYEQLFDDLIYKEYIR